MNKFYLISFIFLSGACASHGPQLEADFVGQQVGPGPSPAGALLSAISPTPDWSPAVTSASSRMTPAANKTKKLEHSAATSVPEAKPTSGGPVPPFWKTRADLYRRIHEDREIIVSAKNETSDQGLKTLTLVSAGEIHASEEFVHKQITNFDGYSKLLPYVQESSYDHTTGNVFIHGALLGYHVRMSLHVVPSTTLRGHQVAWNCVNGSFTGMKGVISEEKTDEEHTEISMVATYTARDLGIPIIILNWGLEFAGRNAAAKMRSSIEEAWQQKK